MTQLLDTKLMASLVTYEDVPKIKPVKLWYERWKGAEVPTLSEELAIGRWWMLREGKPLVFGGCDW